jgi:hypothetical protein
VTRFLRIFALGALLAALLVAPASAYKVVRDQVPPSGTVGVAYSYTFEVSGGTAPHKLRVIVGGLPPGLSMSEGGTVSGTPTQAGAFSFWVEAQDANGALSQSPFTIEIGSKLTITTSGIPVGVVGTAYTAQLGVTGGTASSWSISGGALPSGLTLDNSGRISGTPTSAGTSTFTVQASGNAKADTITLSITVVRPLSVSVVGLPPLIVGKPFTAQLSVGGGAGSVSFSLVGGKLPPGLALDPSAGVVDGIPTRAGTFTAMVGVNSSIGATTTTPLRLVVRPRVDFVTRALPSAKVGRRYAARIVLQGGVDPIALSSTSTFPPGVQLDADTGVLSGTPKVPGVFRVTIVANDAYGGSAVRRFTIVVRR